MEWVKQFFDTAAAWWGAPKPRPSDDRRAATIERLCGPGAKRILDLGAGGGTTALAMATLGHHVTAIEVSSTRVRHARELLRQHPDLDVILVEEDFYTADVGTAFDCVTYWNGFGVGTDEQQRELLCRAASAWLAPAGSMILDVFSPWRWSREAGTTRRVRNTIDLVNAIDFDPVASRFIDSWWPADDDRAVVAQYGRCYSPADLVLLLEGTGLQLARLELDQREVRLDDAASCKALREAWEYSILLTPDA